jgi:hypothetical protein
MIKEKGIYSYNFLNGKKIINVIYVMKKKNII